MVSVPERAETAWIDEMSCTGGRSRHFVGSLRWTFLMRNL